MKFIFAVSFVCLSTVSVARYLKTEPAHDSAPVLYWVTDTNPARIEQVRLFRRWLAKNGHADIDLRLDTANSEIAKKVIQGVSGVAGDIIDMNTSDLPFFVSTGLLADVTDAAHQLNFGPSQTFSAARSLIEWDGRQYRFPCNVITNQLWINRTTFAKYGQPLPPARWDLDTFERMGKRFVAAALKPSQRQTVFYTDSLEPVVLRRSLGLDTFNETLTHCTLDDSRYVQVVEKLHKWTYEDHILPSSADVESFATDSGYGGAALQLFNTGNYAMVRMGRHALLQLRAFGPLQLAVTESPSGSFRNASIATRAPGIYAGSKHKKEAELFLSFLASESYNAQIVADADSLPPNPVYAHGPAFEHPPAFPNEWECHAPFAAAAEEIGIPPSMSPFVLPSVVDRLEQEAFDGYFRSGRLSAGAAAHQAAQTIDREIQRVLAEQPRLRARYDECLRRQNQIDALRAAGKKVPLDLIDNPFHRVLYKTRGWTD